MRKVEPWRCLLDNELDLYWLAGLLEGEGSFVAGPPSSPNCPRIQLPMTDRDVVEHAARLLDRPVWRSDRGQEFGYKPVFLTALKGAAAVQLMKALRPAMGQRRQAQIDHALARPPARRMRWYRRAPACSVAGCARPVKTRALCKLHYHLWWKSTKRGRPSKYLPSGPAGPASIDLVGPLAVPAADTPNAVAWLAGLLEGEGTFEDHRQGRFVYPRLSLSMCDEDIVGRASELLRSPSVWREEPRADGWSPTFVTAITGSRAAEVMRRLRPYMGVRRTQEIDLALDAYHPIRLTDIPAVCAVPECQGAPRGRGLCHKHYMSWSRDRARGCEPRVRALR